MPADMRLLFHGGNATLVGRGTNPDEIRASRIDTATGRCSTALTSNKCGRSLGRSQRTSHRPRSG